MYNSFDYFYICTLYIDHWYTTKVYLILLQYIIHLYLMFRSVYEGLCVWWNKKTTTDLGAKTFYKTIIRHWCVWVQVLALFSSLNKTWQSVTGVPTSFCFCRPNVSNRRTAAVFTLLEDRRRRSRNALHMSAFSYFHVRIASSSGAIRFLWRLAWVSYSVWSVVSSCWFL